MNASPHILRRLRELMDARSVSAFALSRSLGWSKGRVQSKLVTTPTKADGTPNPDYRQTTLAEVDEMLTALGFPGAGLADKATAAAEAAIDQLA